MKTIKDRIRICEAMGWTHIHMKYVAMDETSYPFGCPPADQYSDGKVNTAYKEQIPNPLESHDDCHALIEWLNGRGCDVRVSHLASHKQRHFTALVQFGSNMSRWTGDDYRIGVVELTLKLLDESDG